jgi:ribosome biogenesis GTPase
MHFDPAALGALGWTPHFQSQLDIDELTDTLPARVAAVHRRRVDLLTPDGMTSAEAPPDLPTAGLAVGDWLLTDPMTGALLRRLDRLSLLERRAAGESRASQLIAANLNTLFITTSCNADFNPARLERYLALAAQSEIAPVIVLTKADLCDEPAAYADQARQLGRNLPVETVNAKDPDGLSALMGWCGRGRTVAFVGSSGVGKSTLVNALAGAGLATSGIREDDAKGRHTTTSRSLHPMPGGAWLIDTPGMRALPLQDAGEGIAAVFDDITDLEGACKFSDCAHETEPGCAVQAAVADGRIDPDRLERWRKLTREDAHNTASIAEKRAAGRSLNKVYRAAKKFGRHKRGVEE